MADHRRSDSSRLQSVSATVLLASGSPFKPFPVFSIRDIRPQQSLDANDVFFNDWLQLKIKEGRPFVLRDFNTLDEWDSEFFGLEKLIALSIKTGTHQPNVDFKILS
jgi:hypothetical protein